MQQTITSTNNAIPVERLSSGIYFITVYTDQGILLGLTGCYTKLLSTA